MMLSIRGLYQILAYVYEIINAYSIKSLMVVPFMNLLKSTLSPIPCKCPVSKSSLLFWFSQKLACSFFMHGYIDHDQEQPIGCCWLFTFAKLLILF